MAAVFIMVAVLALTGAVILNTLARLQQRRNAALAALAILREHIAVRRKIAADISISDEKLHLCGLAAALRNIQQPPPDSEVGALAAAEAQFERLLQTAIKQMSPANRLKLAESAVKIERAAAHYNRCVREYNTGILALPAAFFARLYKFGSFETY